MQRNHYLLNNIILPYIHHNRLLSTSRTLAKSSISVEHGSSFSYPTWSYPLAPPSINDTENTSRRAVAESSRAAQLRAELGVEHDKPEARRRELDRNAERDTSLQPSAYGLSTAKRKAFPAQDGDGAQAEPGRRSVYEETVHTAITTLVAIHARPSVPADPSDPATPLAPQTTSQSLSMSSMTASAASSLVEPHGQGPVSQADTIPPLRLPPAINALLRARQFRLAVFHLINSPQSTSSPETFSRVAEWLEREGAGKLARRLRRSVEDRELPQSATSPDGEPGACVKLVGDERGGADDLGRWHGYWRIGPIPPIPLDFADLPAHDSGASGSSTGTTATAARRQRTTNHFNAHLAYLLRKDARSNRPLHLALDLSYRTPGASFPAPRPNLRQLRALLYSIRTLERRFNFVPDRRTANLIVGCWLACVQPGHGSNEHTYDPYMVRSDPSGEEWLAEKIPSQRVFKAGEIMALYGIVSRAMEEAVAGVEERFKSVVRGMKKVDGRWVLGGAMASGAADTGAGGERGHRSGLAGADLDGSGQAGPNDNSASAGASRVQGALERLSRKDEGDIDYDLHIRPFAEMVLRALKRAHGKDELRKVLGWKKEMRDRMELLRLGRLRVRQHLGLPVD